MELLEADISPIVVDGDNGEVTGQTCIHYMKAEFDELWERTNGGSWSQINPHVRTGLGDEAEREGFYPVTLRPGDTYEVSLFEGGNGPNVADPILVAKLEVSCLWKDPGPSKLITDFNSSRGGTWHRHQVVTNEPTRIVTIGVSRKPHRVDSDGIPHLEDPDGELTAPLKITDNHLVEIKPLFPGNHYYFVVLVTDRHGNWQVMEDEFTTLRRKLTVEFPTIHIYNDGDPSGFGEGEFWFRVFTGPHNQPKVIQDFHLPTQDIDDWSETDRPYSVGFAHLGQLEVVDPGPTKEQHVGVASWGVEEDGGTEADEGASNFGVFLPLPTGAFVENVTNSSFTMDCPTSTTGDDFHYGVDVRWSVEYAT